MNAKQPLRPWFNHYFIMLATIMQAVDTTIANVALPHMQGSMSATSEQIAWVLTSYIVAAAVMTPMTCFCRENRPEAIVPVVGIGFTAPRSYVVLLFH